MQSSFDVMPGQATAQGSLPKAESSYQFPEEWFFDAVGGSSTTSGVRVTPDSALGHCPVWQAVNIIAGDLGQLPMRVMRRQVVGEHTRAAEYPDHPVDWLLDEEPNEWQTPDIFIETMIGWCLLYGNGIAVIHGDPGRVKALLPLDPKRTRCIENEEGTAYLIVHTTKRGKELVFSPHEVLHIRGLATNGFWGRSAIDVARDTIGQGVAMKNHGASVFKNGARPSGILKHPNQMDDGPRRQLREEWEAMHRGAGNAHRTAVLWDGMDYQAISMTNDDAQWTDGLKLDREFVASLFNLPAYKLNALENAAVRANVEEQGKEYYQTSLARWANRFRREIARKLFTTAERRTRTLSIKVDTSTLTGGSEDARMTRAAKGVHARLITRNEGREMIGRNPVEEGDEFSNPNIDKGGNREKKEGSDNDPNATDGKLEERDEETKALKSEVAKLRAAVKSLTEEPSDG